MVLNDEDADLNKPNPPPGANMPAALRAASASPNRVRQVGAVLVTRDGTQIAGLQHLSSGGPRP
jgi:hypothetical protein